MKFVRQMLSLHLLPVLIVTGIGPAVVMAQPPGDDLKSVVPDNVGVNRERPGNKGFVREIEPKIEGNEAILQPNLWAFEFHSKPMRMLKVNVTNPKTGEREERLVWYLVYRVVRRPVDRPADSPAEPINDYDTEKTPVFLPEFILITDDNTGTEVYPDEIIPEAQAEISRRERQKLLNTVEMMRELPEPVAEGDDDGFLYGVATWSKIDPETDKFALFIGGLTNRYRIRTGPTGKPLREQKILVQQFVRPGDTIDQREDEIRFVGDPAWIYLPNDEEPEEKLEEADDTTEDPVDPPTDLAPKDDEPLRGFDF